MSSPLTSRQELMNLLPWKRQANQDRVQSVTRTARTHRYYGPMDTQQISTTDSRLSDLFLAYSRRKLLGEYWPRLKSAVQPLGDEAIWWRPNANSNSIGNLILHLNGNVRQWLVSSFNGYRDERNRMIEFRERRLIGGHELLSRLGATIEEAGETLDRLTSDHLERSYEIQGYTVSGLDAVFQVVEHFGMHYGQILWIVKATTAVDFGFYSNLEQNGRAS